MILEGVFGQAIPQARRPHAVHGRAKKLSILTYAGIFSFSDRPRFDSMDVVVWGPDRQ